MSKSNVSHTTIRNRYPFIVEDWEDATQQEVIAAIILDAEMDVGENFGALRERAIVALCAHRIVLQNQERRGDLGGKFILSESTAGGVTARYVVPPPEHLPPEYNHYYTTQPGIDYMELVRRALGLGVRLAV